MSHEHLERRRESLRVRLSIDEERSRRDEKMQTRDLSTVIQEQQEREHLDSLPQAHVVGEASAEPEPHQRQEPPDAVAMVRAELGQEVCTRIVQSGGGTSSDTRERSHQPVAYLDHTDLQT